MSTSSFNITYHQSSPSPSIIINNNNNNNSFCPKSKSISFEKLPLLTRRYCLPANASSVREVLPPVLDSSSDPPPIFDGNPKLYISYSCPYAQRAWIARNCKGLQDIIKLVPIDLKNRPTWYKEKVYPENKVPSLEHNNEVIGESLDLIRYIDSNFQGPPLFPNDLAKIEFAEELFSFTGSFYKAVTTSLKENRMGEAASAFDDFETALSKFGDGPFLLGNFSLVDIAYAPFIERFQAFFSEVKNYDIGKGRPEFAVWVEEMNKIEAYKQTQRDPKEYVESYKRRFLVKISYLEIQNRQNKNWFEQLKADHRFLDQWTRDVK